MDEPTRAARLPARPPRLPAERGWADLRTRPRGPNGRPLCRRCAAEAPIGRLTFCSSDCVHEWKLRTDPAYQAKHIEQRDRGICALCRDDCVATYRRLRGLVDAVDKRQGGSAWAWRGTPIPVVPDGPEGSALITELRRTDWTLVRALSANRPWDIDHIVPVAEGGGACGLDNLRTLCPPCHARVTRELRRRLAAGRKLDQDRGTAEAPLPRAVPGAAGDSGAGAALPAPASLDAEVSP